MIATVRPSILDDHEALFTLYPAAFPDEDLLPVLGHLLADPEALSLVADIEGQVVGHIGFTPCTVEGDHAKLSMLAPLCVAPDLQKQGLGKQLTRYGLERLSADGFSQVLVLGDPNYYRRNGFQREDSIAPPYPIPDDWKPAWQSQKLGHLAPNHVASAPGALIVPDYWRKPELWAG